MGRKLSKRKYESRLRAEAAAETRHRIVREARRLFVERGFTGTTMAAVANAAGVATDTLYAVVGAKSVLFELLIETAISGTDAPVVALQREYVREIRAEPDPGVKIDLYAHAVANILSRMAPLLAVLREAGSAEPALQELWSRIAERRASNMREFAADLKAAGGLRNGLSIDEAADTVWAMNSSEFYQLLVTHRGWTTEQFARWLAHAWRRLLLENQWHTVT